MDNNLSTCIIHHIPPFSPVGDDEGTLAATVTGSPTSTPSSSSSSLAAPRGRARLVLPWGAGAGRCRWADPGRGSPSTDGAWGLRQRGKLQGGGARQRNWGHNDDFPVSNMLVRT